MFLSTLVPKNLRNFGFLENVMKNYVLPNRFKSTDCGKQKSTTCPKGKIRTSSCADNKHLLPPRPESAPREKFVSMWESPKCDSSVAKCPPIRFDDLYYKPSDKAKRKYQQTWVSCPARLVKPVVKCEFIKFKYPPLERRPRKARPETAKNMRKKTSECKVSDRRQNKKCLKIKLPGCGGIRNDVKCKLFRQPSDLKPIPCPYPSYSECTHPKTHPKKRGECECTKIESVCEVWTILRRKAIL